jgi:fructan beta-fructosidase
MSNWLYANVVPTETWRNAMTIPRELRIVKVGNDMRVASRLVNEIAKIRSAPVVLNDISLSKPFDISKKAGTIKFPCLLNLTVEDIKEFSISLSNESGEELLIGYDKMMDQYYIDRTRSGKIDFEKGFAAKHTAPGFSTGAKKNLSLLIDVSSVELFADDGLTVMTEIFFPNQPYNKISILSQNGGIIKKLEYYRLKETSR